MRDVADLLAERGGIVSEETIGRWCQQFGADDVRERKRRPGRLGESGHLDEVFLGVHGPGEYLWRAIDQEGDVIDIRVRRGGIDSLQNGSCAGFYAGQDERCWASSPTD